MLGSIGSVGDAYDNALAESFVDSFKTELIADRVWRTRSQLELAIVEWVGWFNYARLHQALGDIPPAEFEDNALSAITDQGPARPAHILAAGIGVVHELDVGAAASTRQSHAQRVEDEVGAHVIGELPANDPAREDVDDEAEVDHALPAANVGEVRDPEPVGAVGAEMAID